ncbi:DUF3347 domain-containing protein [Arachidicoccus sp.]|uniref:DUF3347 domain-containing protein n=1 Tax=Arachidicoccus sp. TaxID=1872624 RepID=UPI003D197E24
MKYNISFAITLMLSLFSINNSQAALNYQNVNLIKGGTENINDIYAGYAKIEKALTLDDAATAQKAASQLIIELKDIANSNVTLIAATKISQTADISLQRKSFAILSSALYKLFKSQKPDRMLYIHFCPMAKAYWMDENKEISSPYYGEKMLTCGETKGMIM